MNTSAIGTTRAMTFSRMIDQWDGVYPGVSMFELVTRQTKWRELPRKRWSGNGLRHLLFTGEGEGFKIEFHAARWLAGGSIGSEFNFYQVSELYVEFEAEVRPEPRTLVRCLRTPSLGSSTVAIIADYGTDKRYPVIERTVRGSANLISGRINAARQGDKFPESTLKDTAHGQAFLARMALELAIDRRTEVLQGAGGPLTLDETCESFARIIEQGLLKKT